MQNSSPALLVTGVGITSAIGQGQNAFFDALLNGKHAFSVMQREGRQYRDPENGEATRFLGAEIGNLVLPDNVPSNYNRTVSLSARVALTTIAEAWKDAALDDVDPSRIGLIIGGSNLQQRELLLTQQRYKDNPVFIRPTYAMSFMDTDIGGVCSEFFGIRGLVMTTGGASASGQLAVLRALEAVKSDQVDVCIAVGGLMDLSFWECQGFRSLGAMGSDLFADQPDLALRPFDIQHNGFIYGEGCGALVIEKERSHNRHGVKPYARALGWGIRMDANRNPDPSLDGEIHVIRQALRTAGIDAAAIDYFNPHGTGSVIGDETELQAIRETGLDHAWINTTKSITGHGLSAAGSIELVATLLQMRHGQLHPCRNLITPIQPGFNWTGETARAQQITRAIKTSMGFGGINTALCLERI